MLQAASGGAMCRGCSRSGLACGRVSAMLRAAGWLWLCDVSRLRFLPWRETVFQTTVGGVSAMLSSFWLALVGRCVEAALLPGLCGSDAPPVGE